MRAASGDLLICNAFHLFISGGFKIFAFRRKVSWHPVFFPLLQHPPPPFELDRAARTHSSSKGLPQTRASRMAAKEARSRHRK